MKLEGTFGDHYSLQDPDIHSSSNDLSNSLLKICHVCDKKYTKASKKSFLFPKGFAMLNAKVNVLLLCNFIHIQYTYILYTPTIYSCIITYM